MNDKKNSTMHEEKLTSLGYYSSDLNNKHLTTETSEYELLLIQYLYVQYSNGGPVFRPRFNYRCGIQMVV